MKKKISLIARKIRVFRIHIQNLILFTAIALWRGVPLHLWRYAWQQIKIDHYGQVHKAVWELKKEGKVYQDKEGRLWPVKKDQ